MAEESESALTEIPASEILDKIQKGKPVKYDHVRIIGDLKVSKLNLPTKHIDRAKCQVIGLPLESKIVSSKVEIINSKFDGDIDFTNCIVEEDAIFNGTSISRCAAFIGTLFGGDVSFDRASFNGFIGFSGASFSGDVSFDRASFNGFIGFSGASFSGNAWFNGASFSGYIEFSGASFSGYAWFDEASFSEDASFDGAYFGEGIRLSGASFSRNAWFYGASFSESAWFNGAYFGGDVSFVGAYFGGDVSFVGASFNGEILTFTDTYFAEPASQEYACRRAKNVLEKNGDREEAGYHFYREMEAKRKQKESNYRYIDYESLLFYNETNIAPTELKDLFKYLRYNILDYLFIQVIFGYGVHPIRLLVFWLGFAVLFAILYWIGGGINNSTSNQPLNFLDYLWFSITVAVTPGFAGYKPAQGIYQVLAGLEAIFGTFMWAAFITTFARKYMR